MCLHSFHAICYGQFTTLIINAVTAGLVGRIGWTGCAGIFACVLSIVGSSIIGAAGANLPIVMVGLVIKGIGTGPVLSGVFALTADVVDYGEWKTGVRSEGLVNSCTSFGMKVGIELGSAVSAWILAFGGYDGTVAVQSASAVASIKFAYGYLGAIISAVCLLIIVAMNIDKDIKKIRSDLEAKRINA